MQRPTYDDLAEALTLRPEREDDLPGTRVWLHVTGSNDTGILFEFNGHTVGWLSGFEIAKMAMRVSKKVGQ
jgi:hypothetical protein